MIKALMMVIRETVTQGVTCPPPKRNLILRLKWKQKTGEIKVLFHDPCLCATYAISVKFRQVFLDVRHSNLELL
jgi:hypothetical protein